MSGGFQKPRQDLTIGFSTGKLVHQGVGIGADKVKEAPIHGAIENVIPVFGCNGRPPLIQQSGENDKSSQSNGLRGGALVKSGPVMTISYSRTMLFLKRSKDAIKARKIHFLNERVLDEL